MKRFLLFGWDQCYPRGGFNDFVESFDTLEQAIDYPPTQDRYQIWDSQTGRIIMKAGA